MTVKQVIEILSSMPEDKNVAVFTSKDQTEQIDRIYYIQQLYPNGEVVIFLKP